MNKSLFVAMCVFLLAGGWSEAQITSGTEQLPPGPLIVGKMPGAAQWTVDYAYADPPKPGTESAKLAGLKEMAAKDPVLAKAMANPQFVFSLDTPRPLHVAITKTGKIRHETRELERNFKSESWTVGECVVERRPNAPTLIAYLGGGGAKEFPEFNWISEANFIGIKKLAGMDCLVFQEEINPLQISFPERFAGDKKRGMEKGNGSGGVRAIAYIDSQTRYPVALQLGTEARHYTFFPTPVNTLSVPEDFAAAAREAKSRIDAVTKPLAKP